MNTPATPNKHLTGLAGLPIRVPMRIVVISSCGNVGKDRPRQNACFAMPLSGFQMVRKELFAAELMVVENEAA